MGVDAAAVDRLPWLADEPTPQRMKQRRGSLVRWAAAPILVVAVGTFWIGAQSVREPQAGHTIASTTVILPPPRTAAPAEVRIARQPQVPQSQAPEVQPVPAREVQIVAPLPRTPDVRRTKRGKNSAQKMAPERTRAAPAPAIPATRLATPSLVARRSNPHVFARAAASAVQVGAFGSAHQAKQGWRFMVHAYPAMAHLPTAIRVTRNSRGRPFFRFEVAETPQGGSEVLCRRMAKIGLSCAVVGPRKIKVGR